MFPGHDHIYERLCSIQGPAGDQRWGLDTQVRIVFFDFQHPYKTHHRQSSPDGYLEEGICLQFSKMNIFISP